ncbi:MAG TPA: rhodanese-like domain-containing protein [Polyangiaceae bacterium]|nr:rhodanese-like domain-containing protein [Polyangiaceae bacterium]
MATRTVDPKAAYELLQQGYLFLDVRSELEFALGHAPHAYNVPISQPQYDQLIPNPDFLKIVCANVPRLTPLVVGCHATARSARACAELEGAGYTNLVHVIPGWDGQRDAFGRILPGWSRLGLPAETGDGGERGYAALLAQAILGERSS